MPGMCQKLSLVFWPFRSRSKQCDFSTLFEKNYKAHFCFQISPSIECLTSDIGFVETVTEHPRFDAIFLNFKNLSKKALYSISFECELKQDEPETIESTKYEKLHEKLGKLCLQDELSDVEIICDGKTFKCHKMILCAQSDPFKGKLCMSVRFCIDFIAF